jgi:hypothetical protein
VAVTEQELQEEVERLRLERDAAREGLVGAEHFIQSLLQRLDSMEADRCALIEELNTPGIPTSGHRLLMRTVLLGTNRRALRAQAERDRYRSAWLSARRGRSLWKNLYLNKALPQDGRMVSLGYHDRLMRKYQHEVNRLEAELYGTPPPVRPKCGRTEHCTLYGFCHRCDPEFSDQVMRKFEATDGSIAAYAAVIASMPGER